jgi:glycerol-3-phosphate O-acyltransferase
MAASPGLFLRLMGHFFFRPVLFDARSQALLSEHATRHTVVYALHTQSILDYMYLNWAFAQKGLPLVIWADHFGLLQSVFWRPVSWVLGRLMGKIFGSQRGPEPGLASALARGGPVVVFLRPARSLLQWGASYRDELLAELIASANQAPQPVVVVATKLVWRRHTESARPSVLQLAFGHPDAPGKARKLINFLLNYRTAFIRFSAPLDLHATLAPHRERLGDDHAALARELRYEITQTLALEQKVMSGPVLKGSKQLRQEILRNPEFEAAVRTQAEADGKSVEAANREVAGYLAEMAADFRLKYVELLCIFLGIMWSRLYEGVHIYDEEIEGLRSAAKGAPLVITPNHRSHIDYLVISYIFYVQGLIPPHIAAGINLSFFPMGHIFRHSGAFFIRRSFRGNPLYQLAFRYYVRKLVKEGYWIEFFPEGGRSRTGKVLAPKVGLLRELVSAVAVGVTEDLAFCPTSISYEKVVEQKSITRELAGAEKQAENVGTMVKASKALASKHGRLYLRFSEPVSIRKFIDERVAVRGSLDAFLENDTFSDELMRFTYRILHGINRACVLTASALVSMVVLAHPRKGIASSQLRLRCGYLLDYFHREKGANLSESLRQAYEGSAELLCVPEKVAIFDRAPHGSLAYGKNLYRARILARQLTGVVDDQIRSFSADELLVVRNYGDELAYSAVPEKRVTLDYYKNNIIHLVVREAIISTALLAGGRGTVVPFKLLRARCLFLSTLFRREFVYDPDDKFDHQFEGTLAQFVSAGWISQNEDKSYNVHQDADELLVFFARCIQNFVEGYLVAFQALREAAQEPMREKDFIKQAMRRGSELFQAGDNLFAEAASTAVLRNALELALDEKLVVKVAPPDAAKSTSGRRRKTEPLLSVEPTGLAGLEAWISPLRELRVTALGTAVDPAASVQLTRTAG